MEFVSTEFKILKVFFRHCKCKLLCFLRVTLVRASFYQAHANSKLQKPGVAMLIPDKIDFKTEIITKGEKNILITKRVNLPGRCDLQQIVLFLCLSFLTC